MYNEYYKRNLGLWGMPRIIGQYWVIWRYWPIPNIGQYWVIWRYWPIPNIGQ